MPGANLMEMTERIKRIASGAYKIVKWTVKVFILVFFMNLIIDYVMNSTIEPTRIFFDAKMKAPHAARNLCLLLMLECHIFRGRNCTP